MAGVMQSECDWPQKPDCVTYRFSATRAKAALRDARSSAAPRGGGNAGPAALRAACRQRDETPRSTCAVLITIAQGIQTHRIRPVSPVGGLRARTGHTDEAAREVRTDVCCWPPICAT